jgi:hypothetical protein
MSLADAMPDTLHLPLKVDVLLAQLDPHDADTLRDWLSNPSVSANSIADALTANGTPITSNPIRTWRKRHVAG